MNFEWHFRHHVGRRLDKWRHYFDIYDRHFDRFRGEDVRILEIGVDHGGSLQLWKRYFGVDAQIVGVDKDPRCGALAEEQIDIKIGNQADIEFLKGLGAFDIVIDDGSHNQMDQLASFETLWPKTRHVYLIEDCHDAAPRLAGAPIVYYYPWVVVAEKPERLIRGDPSRDLRKDEIDAAERYGC